MAPTLPQATAPRTDATPRRATAPRTDAMPRRATAPRTDATPPRAKLPRKATTQRGRPTQQRKPIKRFGVTALCGATAKKSLVSCAKGQESNDGRLATSGNNDMLLMYVYDNSERSNCSLSVACDRFCRSSTTKPQKHCNNTCQRKKLIFSWCPHMRTVATPPNAKSERSKIISSLPCAAPTLNSHLTCGTSFSHKRY